MLWPLVTALTIRLARRHGKPCLVVDLKKPADPSSLRDLAGEEPNRGPECGRATGE